MVYLGHCTKAVHRQQIADGTRSGILHIRIVWLLLNCVELFVPCQQIADGTLSGILHTRIVWPLFNCFEMLVPSKNTRKTHIWPVFGSTNQSANFRSRPNVDTTVLVHVYQFVCSEHCWGLSYVMIADMIHIPLYH